ncbi:hypothetical protein D3C72_332500 [compost metagenome]
MKDAVQFEIEKDQIRDLTLVEVDDVAGAVTPPSWLCEWIRTLTYEKVVPIETR